MKALAAALSSSALLVRRRAVRDRGLLLTVIALIATAAMLSVVGPGLVLGTIDRGAQEAVAASAGSADVVVNSTVAQPTPGVSAHTPEAIVTFAPTVAESLPPGLAEVYSQTTLTVIGGESRVRAVDGEPWTGAGELRTVVTMLTPSNTTALEVVDGRLPEPRSSDDASPIEVVVSVEAASIGLIELGSMLSIGQPAAEEPQADEPVVVSLFEVVGIVQPIDRAGVEWTDNPELWTPLERPASAGNVQLTRVTVMAAPDGIAAASLAVTDPFEGLVRLHLDPQNFTAKLAALTTDEAHELRANAQSLSGESRVALSVTTDLEDVLHDFPAQSRAALAQMSVMMAGVIGVAGVVIVLLSRLVVSRRTAAIALERARGASVVSVGVRTFAESLVTTVVGVTLGVVVALIVQQRAISDPLALVSVALVSLLAAPVLAMAVAQQLWTGRREPANRADRQALAKRRRSQRVVIELSVAVIALAALVSLRGRGLLQNRTEGIDPFLAVAPLLLAAAFTILVIRLYPLPIRLASAAAQRTTGVLGLLGAVRARSAVAALPLLALTLGAALTVSGGLLVDTVRTGQAEASWQRVGADARISAELSEAELESLRASAGVSVVSATRPREGVGLDLGTRSTSITVMAIDEHYADLVDTLPASPSSASIRELATTVSGERLSVVVDNETAGHLISDDIAMFYGPLYVELHVIGTTSIAPEGYVEGPYIYADLESLSALLPEGLPATSVLLTGAGAGAAAESLDVDQDDVLTRAEWIQSRQDSALIGGVESTMLFAVVAVAILAAVALVATVVSGAPARGRALSMLRTLGMSPRLGWWLALAELAPLVIAAILGGVAAGLVVVLALAPSLGLDVLAGGTSVPRASIEPSVFIALAGGAALLLLIGVLADVLAHRRDKLSEVLRVGETA